MPLFKIISDEEVKMIHEGSLSLLKKIGVEVPQKAWKAWEKLEKA